MSANSRKQTTANHPYGVEYSYFCTKVAELSGINLRNYKSKQMHRRLVSYMNRRNIPDFATFAMRLQKDPEQLAHLVDYLTINVSEFFRNEKQWNILASEVVPQMANLTNRRINVWSAGSAAGQEAYSVAIIFAENLHYNVSVLGTDIDEASLAKAKQATYTPDEVKNVPPRLLARYFTRQDNLYVVKDAIRQLVDFRRHDLLGPDYPGNMDLVLCRNVLIYFTEEGKQHVITKLADCLKPGGVLFMGATEAIFNSKDYGLTQSFPFFYQRKR